MEKIAGEKLIEVGNILLENFRTLLCKSERDPGLELTLSASTFQQNLVLNCFDEIHLLFKVYPHKNAARESITRLDVYLSRGQDVRGNRVASIELPRSDDLKQDVESFVDGVLSRSGIKKPH